MKTLGDGFLFTLEEPSDLSNPPVLKRYLRNRLNCMLHRLDCMFRSRSSAYGGL